MSKKPTKAQIRAMLKKVNALSCKHTREERKFSSMCKEYYGDINYSETDKDEIIDCVDYGMDMIEFERFDEIMREINSKKEEE